jgi:GWxTD domain-containing protein
MKSSFILLFFLIAGSIYPQNNLQFEFDYSRFKYDSTSVYLELYYSVGVKSLTKLKKNETSYVEAILHIKMIESVANEVIVDKKYRINSPYQENSTENSLLGVVGLGIPFGTYALNIEVVDVGDSLNMSSFSEKVTLNSLGTDKASISDIQLASRIITRSQNTKSLFYKNTMEVFPHPIGVFGQNIPMLFFYAELYNLKADTTSSDFILNEQVVNSYGVKVYEKTKKVNRVNDSIVEVGAVNITKFPSGSYSLILNLFAENSLSGIASSKKFYLFNPGVEDTFQIAVGDYNVLSSEFGIYSLEECDAHFARCEPIALPDEIDQYENLEGVESKREFLFNFWKIRDNIPETPKNEAKEEYMKRISLVDVRYKTFSRQGYKTDRGRVYLQYGEPDEIELHPNDYDKKPHEIWYYHSIEGGVLFVFGDITGYADYELLHSTKRGELRDDDWVRRISTL